MFDQINVWFNKLKQIMFILCKFVCIYYLFVQTILILLVLCVLWQKIADMYWAI